MVVDAQQVMVVAGLSVPVKTPGEDLNVHSVQCPTVLSAHYQERGVVHVIVNTFCKTTLDNAVSS